MIDTKIKRQKEPLRSLKRMYEVILEGNLAMCRKKYLLFHRFQAQNGLLGLSGLNFCITEVINIMWNFLDLIYNPEISVWR